MEERNAPELAHMGLSEGVVRHAPCCSAVVLVQEALARW